MTKWDCVKCGHDTEGEGGNPWLGAGGSRICKSCSAVFARELYALLGLEGVSYDEYGPDIQWHQVAQILARPHERDMAMRATYYEFVITDEQRGEAAAID